MAKRSGNGKSTVGCCLNRVGVHDIIDCSYARIVGPCIGLRANDEEGRIDRGSGVGAAAALAVQRRPQQQRAGL